MAKKKAAKRGKPKRGPDKLTKAKFLNALDGSLGLITSIAKRAGVHRETVYNLLKRHPELRVEIEREKAKIVDRAEAGLFQRVNQGDWNAIRYILNRLGKERGYTMRNEVSLSGEVKNHLSAEEFRRAWIQAKEGGEKE